MGLGLMPLDVRLLQRRLRHVLTNPELLADGVDHPHLVGGRGRGKVGVGVGVS